MVRVVFQGLFQCIGVNAVCLNGNAGKTTVVGAEAVEGADKRRVLACNNVTLIAEGLCKELHDLSGTTGYNKRVIIGSNVVALLHDFGELFHQRSIPFGNSILECSNRLFVKNFRGDLPNGVNGEGLRCRVSGGKRDDLRVGCGLQNFPHSGGLETGNSVGELVFHSGSSFQLHKYAINFITQGLCFQ